jgi:hypothetical protein
MYAFGIVHHAPIISLHGHLGYAKIACVYFVKLEYIFDVFQFVLSKLQVFKLFFAFQGESVVIFEAIDPKYFQYQDC